MSAALLQGQSMTVFKDGLGRQIVKLGSEGLLFNGNNDFDDFRETMSDYRKKEKPIFLVK